MPEAASQRVRDTPRSEGLAIQAEGRAVEHWIHARRIESKFFKGKRTVAVGDGWTDFMLLQEGIAQEFFAYTEHVTRQKVVDAAPRIAGSVADLRTAIFG